MFDNTNSNDIDSNNSTANDATAQIDILNLILTNMQMIKTLTIINTNNFVINCTNFISSTLCPFGFILQTYLFLL